MIKKKVILIKNGEIIFLQQMFDDIFRIATKTGTNIGHDFLDDAMARFISNVIDKGKDFNPFAVPVEIRPFIDLFIRIGRIAGDEFMCVTKTEFDKLYPDGKIIKIMITDLDGRELPDDLTDRISKRGYDVFKKNVVNDVFSKHSDN